MQTGVQVEPVRRTQVCRDCGTAEYFDQNCRKPHGKGTENHAGKVERLSAFDHCDVKRISEPKLNNTADHIDDLIAGYLAGEASPAQVEAVERWREASEENAR